MEVVVARLTPTQSSPMTLVLTRSGWNADGPVMTDVTTGLARGVTNATLFIRLGGDRNILGANLTPTLSWGCSPRLHRSYFPKVLQEGISERQMLGPTIHLDFISSCDMFPISRFLSCTAAPPMFGMGVKILRP